MDTATTKSPARPSGIVRQVYCDLCGKNMLVSNVKYTQSGILCDTCMAATLADFRSHRIAAGFHNSPDAFNGEYFDQGSWDDIVKSYEEA